MTVQEDSCLEGGEGFWRETAVRGGGYGDDLRSQTDIQLSTDTTSLNCEEVPGGPRPLIQAGTSMGLALGKGELGAQGTTQKGCPAQGQPSLTQRGTVPLKVPQVCHSPDPTLCLQL